MRATRDILQLAKRVMSTPSEDEIEERTLRADDSDTIRGAAARPLDGLGRGATVGRYVLLGRVGAGAMGVVHAAYDPHLDRRIALKLLGPDATGGTEGKARMFSEAQALAKLAHPNVVVVHDVGAVEANATERGEPLVYLAMEFIEGTTLKAWCAAEKRSWQTVLDAFVAAGRGLAAAHAAGLVHRDFKPDNVMIASSGRVVVMDFGLARAMQHEPLAGPTGPQNIDTSLTLTGKIVGTPAYLAPEAYGEDRRRIGPWSDQFSFCVAFYEALYDQRPFLADSLVEQMRAVTSGSIREPPAKSGVPSWLHAAIVRGLAVEPEARHASMDALLAELARGQTRGRRIRVGVVVAAGLALAGGWAASGRSAERECETGAEQIDARWSADRREAIAAAFAATRMPSAATQATSTADLVDAYVAQWRAMYIDACSASHVRREQSDALLDVRMRCLRDRSAQLDALLVELEAADVEIVGEAIKAARQLPAIADCRDPTVPGEGEARDAADERVIAARARLAIARARGDAGRFAAGLDAVDEAEAALGEVASPRVRAEVLLVRARLLEPAGRRDEAEQALRTAIVLATEAGDHTTAAKAWIELVGVVGFGTPRSDEALALVLAADAEIAAAGHDLVLRRQRLNTEAVVRKDKGQTERALALVDEALALAHEAGADPTVLAILHANRGNMFDDLGRYDEAEAEHERALELDVEAYGERHPDVAADLANLARDVGRHDLERARDLDTKALAIREEFHGPESADAGEVVLSLAVNALDRGDLPTAKTLGDRALAIFGASLPAGHMHFAAVHNHLGIVASKMGRSDEAVAHYLEVERIVRSAHGDRHPQVATALQNRANVLLARGDAAAALPLYEEALAIKNETRGPDHPSLAPLLAMQADALATLGRYDEAKAAIERALAIHRAANSEPDDIAWAEYIQARIELETPGATRAAREHARTQARRSLATLRRATAGTNAREIATIESWLAAHDSGRVGAGSTLVDPHPR